MTVAELIEEPQRMPHYLPVLVESVDWVDSSNHVPSHGTSCSSIASVDRSGTCVILDATGGVL